MAKMVEREDNQSMDVFYVDACMMFKQACSLCRNIVPVSSTLCGWLAGCGTHLSQGDFAELHQSVLPGERPLVHLQDGHFLGKLSETLLESVGITGQHLLQFLVIGRKELVYSQPHHGSLLLHSSSETFHGVILKEPTLQRTLTLAISHFKTFFKAQQLLGAYMYPHTVP